MDPSKAAQILSLVPPKQASQVLGLVAPDKAAGILAAMPDRQVVDAILATMSEDTAATIRTAMQSILNQDIPNIQGMAPADAAATLAGIDPNRSIQALAALPPDTVAQILAAMDPAGAASVLGLVSPEQAADVLRLMPASDANAILAAITTPGTRSAITALLTPASANPSDLASMPPDQIADTIRTMSDAGEAAADLASLNDPGMIAIVLSGLTDKDIVRLLNYGKTTDAAIVASGLGGYRAGRILEKLPSPGKAANIMKAMPLAAVQAQVPYISAEVLAEYARQADPHVAAMAMTQADTWQLADAFGRLSSARAGDILSGVESADMAADVLLSMPDGKAGSILTAMSTQELEALLSNIPPDKAALVLSMAGDRAEGLISSLPPETLAHLPADGGRIASAGADPWLASLLGAPAAKIISGIIH